MQGIEECSICYCILHTNNELPKRTCRTCKKKFHDACLVSLTRKTNIGYPNELFSFSFVGFDHQINQLVHIAVQTFNFFMFLLCLFVFNYSRSVFDINVLYEICSDTKKNAYKQKYSLVIDCSMSVDKAKEAAAIAAVNEHINHVGRRIRNVFRSNVQIWCFRMYM